MEGRPSSATPRSTRRPPLQLPTVTVQAEETKTSTVAALVSPFFTPGPDILSPTAVRMGPSGSSFTRWRSERLSSGSDSAVQLSPPSTHFISHSLTNILAPFSPLSPPGLSPLQLTGDSAFSTPTTSKSTGSRFTFDHVPFRRTGSAADGTTSPLAHDDAQSAFRVLDKKTDGEKLLDVLKTLSGEMAAKQPLRSHPTLERKQSLMPGAGVPTHLAALRSESLPLSSSSAFRPKPLLGPQLSAQLPSPSSTASSTTGLSVLIDPPSDESPSRMASASASTISLWSSLYAAHAAALASTTSLKGAAALGPSLLSPRGGAASSAPSSTSLNSSSKVSPSGSAASMADESDLDPDDPRRTQFWCHHCQKDFRRPDILSRHLRRHTGEKPFGCDRCGRHFSRSDHLRTHRRTHTDEKPYQCALCAYAARRRDVLTRHMATRHQAKAGRSIFQKNEVRRCLSDSDRICAVTEVLGPIGDPKRSASGLRGRREEMEMEGEGREDEASDEDEYSDDDDDIHVDDDDPPLGTEIPE